MALRASHYTMRAGHTTVLPNGMAVEAPGRLVPLIAVDQLPSWLDIVGVPREIKPSDAVNMVAVGSYVKTESQRGSTSGTDEDDVEIFQVRIKTHALNEAQEGSMSSRQEEEATTGSYSPPIAHSTTVLSTNMARNSAITNTFVTHSKNDNPFDGFSGNNTRNNSIPTVPSLDQSSYSSASSDAGSVASTTCSAAVALPNVDMAKRACNDIAKKCSRYEPCQAHNADGQQYRPSKQNSQAIQQAATVHQQVSRTAEGKSVSQATQRSILEADESTSNDELEEAMGIDWDHWSQPHNRLYPNSKGRNNGPESNKTNSDLGKFWGQPKRGSKNGRKAAEPRVYCRTWLKGGNCPYGKKCRFIHEMPSTIQALKNAGVTAWPSWWLAWKGNASGREEVDRASGSGHCPDPILVEL